MLTQAGASAQAEEQEGPLGSRKTRRDQSADGELAGKGGEERAPSGGSMRAAGVRSGEGCRL